ncbi:MAG: N-acetylneuraminate synthase family protein [Armatimonadetes bacterium]|nr:N-acetylneuraminate synthase family protein [Armatimonadota bacterium]
MTRFNATFDIACRPVGVGAPVLIIAEAGVNHFGDLGKALALVDLAADAGADVFKTQAFSTDRLVSARLPEWRQRMRPKEISFDFLRAVKEHCEERGILFMCTAHDESVLPWLDQLEVPAFKIGSGERGNTPYFAEVARRGKPVILSTGMYTTAHVRETMDTFAAAGCRDLALLHCVTSYPTPYDQVNLRAMDTLKEMFTGPVGYSDHTDGHHAVLAAVARGAAIVEKHITLDFDVPEAQDWKVSAGPDDLSHLVRQIREVEMALGSGEKDTQSCEAEALTWALKSLVAARDLARGTVLAGDMVVAKRPGDGLAPSCLADILGRRLKRDVAADEPITLALLDP